MNETSHKEVGKSLVRGRPALMQRLSTKLIAVVVAVCIVGAVLSALAVTTTIRSRLLADFTDARDEITRQAASTMAGALRWKKTDIVAASYKDLVGGSAGVATLLAMTPDNTVLSQFSDSGATGEDLAAFFQANKDALIAARGKLSQRSYRDRCCRNRQKRSVTGLNCRRLEDEWH